MSTRRDKVFSPKKEEEKKVETIENFSGNISFDVENLKNKKKIEETSAKKQ